MSLTVHSETLGISGARELVMVHGWGMHSGLLRPLAEDLAAERRVTLIDLPGHGASSPYARVDQAVAEAWVDAIAGAVPEGADLLGWSLGGILGIPLAARYPEKVRRLVLMAATPRFTRARDWPTAVSPDMLDAFINAVRRQPRKTLLRFANLQLQGDERSAAHLRVVRRALSDGPVADDQALIQGLDLLASEDYRDLLGGLSQPVLALLGATDSLMPTGLGDAMRALNPRLRVRELSGVAHLPFLSEQEIVRDVLREFLDE